MTIGLQVGAKAVNRMRVVRADRRATSRGSAPTRTIAASTATGKDISRASAQNLESPENKERRAAVALEDRHHREVSGGENLAFFWMRRGKYGATEKFKLG